MAKPHNRADGHGYDQISIGDHCTLRADNRADYEKPQRPVPFLPLYPHFTGWIFVPS